MLPLDLTIAPPRSPKERLNGLCMLPRMIDIARASLTGGQLDEYQIGRGISAVVFEALKITPSQFIQIVQDSADDPDVAVRLSLGEEVRRYTELTTRLESITVNDVPAESRERFERYYGTDFPHGYRIFDVLEADDAMKFGKHV